MPFHKSCVNCNRLFGCEKLKNDKKLKELAQYTDIKSMNEYNKYMHNNICDNYNSMFIEYPIEVAGIKTDANFGAYRKDEVGKYVRVAPCSEKYGNKTYLGIYLGDLPIDNSVSYDEETKILNVGFSCNPAIFVPDLNKIIYGRECFWQVIESPKDLKDITQDEINSVWYVKALKGLGGSKDDKSKNKNED